MSRYSITPAQRRFVQGHNWRSSGLYVCSSTSLAQLRAYMYMECVDGCQVGVNSNPWTRGFGVESHGHVRGERLQVTFFLLAKCIVKSSVFGRRSTQPSTRLSVHVASPTHMRCSCSEGEGGSVWGARVVASVRFQVGENLLSECVKIMTRSIPTRHTFIFSRRARTAATVATVGFD